jgi:hypothetical protein
MWLRDGGIHLVNMPPYWFPSLVEGLFVWPLAMRSDPGAQLLHFVFGLLVVLLMWFWVRELWGDHAGWWAIILLLTMPSLMWLAAWAYTDLALVFFSLGMLYALWKWDQTADSGWVMIVAAISGFAMGVKYTSFIVPVFAGLSILAKTFYKNANPAGRKRSLVDLIRFGLVAGMVACPWYLRNWIWMRNPFYPFLFGGPFWDSFRAGWYAASGTGLGWNFVELFMLPLNAMLGHREAFNYFDGRTGPFFLLLFPLVLWVLWAAHRDRVAGRNSALMIAGMFSAASMAFWVYGVINSASLWQMRMLFPGLIALIMPMAVAVQKINELDTPRLRVSFLFSASIGLTVFIILLDFGLMVLLRHPLNVALGMETRQQYLLRIQPEYAQALELVRQTPVDARIYFLCEARSYGMERDVQPDTINDNLVHDFYLSRNAEGIISNWQRNGYTHLLLSRGGLAALMDAKPTLTPDEWQEEARLEQILKVMATSSNGDYVLFVIPPK